MPRTTSSWPTTATTASRFSGRTWGSRGSGAIRETKRGSSTGPPPWPSAPAAPSSWWTLKTTASKNSTWPRPDVRRLIPAATTAGQGEPILVMGDFLLAGRPRLHRRGPGNLREAGGFFLFHFLSFYLPQRNELNGISG